jgi:hypothetical protein
VKPYEENNLLKQWERVKITGTMGEGKGCGLEYLILGS